MDIKSLRIGDWVLDKAVSDKPVQIEQINEKNVHYKHGKGYMSAGIELLEPIAVTPEFLLKNGFVEMSKGRYVCHVMTGDGYFDIRLKDLNNGTWMLVISSWNKTTDSTSMFTASNAKMSVYELQHYIADCKIDKQIVL